MQPPIKQALHTNAAPEALGPYSQAVVIGDFLFTSGQVPIDPKIGKLCEGDIEKQTTQVMKNLECILQTKGCSFDHVIKSTIYLLDMGNFQRVNAIYGEYFKAPYPSRSTVQVAALPLGATIEIDMIAHLPSA